MPDVLVLLAVVGIIATLSWVATVHGKLGEMNAKRDALAAPLVIFSPEGWDRVLWGQTVEEVQSTYPTAKASELSFGRRGPRSCTWSLQVERDDSTNVTAVRGSLFFWGGILVGVNALASARTALALYEARGCPEIYTRSIGGSDNELLYVWTSHYTRTIVYENRYTEGEFGFNFLSYARAAERSDTGLESPTIWQRAEPRDDFSARWKASLRVR